MKQPTYARQKSLTKRRPARAGSEQEFEIEEVTARAGVSVRLVHHCQARGLIQGSQSAAASRRRYTHEDVNVLRFARRVHVLGFGMNEVASLICMWQDIHVAGSAVKGIARPKAGEPETRIVERQARTCVMERLVNLLSVAHQPACPILDELMADRAC